jgi:hypothetical protein
MANSIGDQTRALADLAEDALSSARTTASRINIAIPALTDAEFSFDPKKPVMAPPPQFSDLFPGADSSGEQIQFLNGEVDKWIDKYFPELNACLKSAPEQWVCNILSGENEYGLNRTVFEIVWHRARDRAYRASATEQSTLQAQFSERGFSVPPGALLHMQNEAEQRAGNAIAEVNREQQVRESEIKLDLLKFAADQAVRLKLGIMDALRAFYVQWAQLPDKDIERARIRAQAQASLYSALSSYYNVELGFEQVRLRAAEAKAGIGIDNNRVKTANADSGRNAALGQAVRAFADVSASAANAGGALFANITQG